MPTATKKRADPAFWDASGVVLLATEQRDSIRARTLRRTSGRMVLWWGARLEVSSALARLHREGALDAAGVAVSEARLDALARTATEIQPTDEVRERALSLVHAHPLRAADALQVAAALVAVGGRPAGRVLVTFDARLAVVARTLGFDVRP